MRVLNKLRKLSEGSAKQLKNKQVSTLSFVGARRKRLNVNSVKRQ